MKPLFKFLCVIVAALLLQTASAQVPQGIPYQSVIRNSSGAVVANQNVSLRFSIRDSIATGAIVYRETHAVTTTAQGLTNVNIGMGTPVTGTFSTINWGNNNKYIQVEADITGGTNYIDLGTTQMMSVPYAQYAGSSQFSNLCVNGLKGHYGFDRSTNWTCPSGIYSIEVELWGGGGGGGGGSVNNSIGSVAGNGGRGGYAKAIVNVVPNTTYTITIGQGGYAGTYATNGSGTLSSVNGTNGGSTAFSSLLTAQGGQGGQGFFVNGNGALVQSGVNGQSGSIVNYNVTPLSSRSYIPSGYTVLFPGSTANGGTRAYYYLNSNQGPGTDGESGFCVISY